MTQQRLDLARRIASGLAGWFQFRAAQRLQHMPGEDSFRLGCAEIIHAQGRYLLKTSQRPSNWPANTQKRIDMALLPTSAGGTGWYGALELKWPSASGNFQGSRLKIVQDAVRLATVSTANLNARLLVLGGPQRVINRLFDHPHPQAAAREAERVFFSDLLRREAKNPVVTKTTAQLVAGFAAALDRLPTGLEHPSGIQVRLLASATAKIGNDDAGHVYVWQCNKRRGRAPAP